MSTSFSFCRSLLYCVLLATGCCAANAADLLKVGKPVAIPGTKGRFDFLAIDADHRRLLAAHTGNNSLDVIDLDKASVVKVVPTGAAQSSVVDARRGAYYVSVSKPPQLAVIDAEKLEVTASIPLKGPADLLTLDPKSGQAYVGHDDGKELWIVDPDKKTVAATVDLPGEAPEDLAFSKDGARLFQAMKTGSLVAVVDVASKKVVAKWPTAPAEGPHGMAAVPEFDAILLAGAKGKLVMMSQADGKVVAHAAIAEGVDQIAYDEHLKRVYCASRTGTISVVGVAKDKLSPLGSVVTFAGAKSIAVDPKTHTVWIAYATGEASFVVPLVPEGPQ